MNALIDPDITVLFAALRVYHVWEVTRTRRLYLAALAATLLLFPIFALIPSITASAAVSRLETLDGAVNAGFGETEQSNIELNVMHFTPSASIGNGIYYVARRGADAIAYFAESEVHYVGGDTLIRLDFPGSVGVVPIGEEPTGSVTSYMLGNDPSKWRTGLRDCAVIRYADLYLGIDLVYRILDGNIKYEFVVAPGADPSLIQMRYPDADLVEVCDDSVAVSRNGFKVFDAGLMVLQESGKLVVGECSFRTHDEDTVGFSIGRYDSSRELIVDPVLLTYSTFFGGYGEDSGRAIAVENGFVYFAGYTMNPTMFPIINAYDPEYNSGYDCFVAKLANSGQSLVYSTFLGGSQADYAYGIAVEDGFAYVTGRTDSSDFPTVNAYDSSFSSVDCFLTKLAADGSALVYSTFLGGTSYEMCYGIAVENGSAYVAGRTRSSDFPMVNAFDPVYGAGDDCFVTKVEADGQSLEYSTYIGGNSDDYAYGIAAENGFAYITGYTWSSDFPTANAFNSTFNGATDCFVTKLAANGSTLLYSTFLGGGLGQTGYGIAVENGSAYVTGWTGSPDFPAVNAFDSTYNGDYDCFVTKLAADGQSLAYSTFLGGSSDETAFGIAVENGFAYVFGSTRSFGFPTAHAVDSTINGLIMPYDCFVTKFTPDGRFLVYSTFLGGTNDDRGNGIAVENGSAYVIGETLSPDFPVLNAYEWTHKDDYDCFVAVISGDTDSDTDGLWDWEETTIGTDPFCIDSDNDNFLDGYEVTFGSDPLDPMSYPAMPQVWYDAIYEDLDGNTTLIQYLIGWSNGNSTLLQTVMQQLDDNATLLEQVISWLDGNHTAIEALFTFVDGNATLLIQTVNAVNANTDQLTLLAALVTHNAEALSALNATHIGDIDQIRAIMDMLGATIGDTDYDGLDDLYETALGTDIQCIDTDCDNLNDAYEVKIGTDPTDDDSDNDGYYDGAEVLAGTDPLDSLDHPGGSTTITTTTTATATQPPMGLELVIIAGGVGCIGIVALLVIMRRRAGTK